MKQLGIATLLVLVVMLGACGSSNSNSTDISGNWTATLTDVNGATDFAFTTTLTESGTTISGSNLTFTTGSPCFGTGTTESGGFTASGTTNGVTSGVFQLTVQSGASSANGDNTLNLQGTLNNNTVSGTWTLTGTGTGCVGSGNFSMTRS